MLIVSKVFSPRWYGAVFCLLLLHLSSPFGCAEALHLNGNWSIPYGDDDGPWILGQSYSVSVDQEITAAMNIGGNVRYTTTEQQSSDKTSTLTPSLFFGITNDLFRFNLSGSQSDRKTGSEPTATTRSWTSSISTNIPNQLWPQFRLSYGETKDTNDANPATIDSDSENLSTSVDYTWRYIKFLYSYRHDNTTDRPSNSKSKTIGHSTNIQLSKDLFDNRLSVSASHQYSINTTKVSTITVGGQVLVDLVASAAYAGVDNTPSDGALPALPTLNDQDFFTSTGLGIPSVSDSLNLALQINLQTFQRLEFYFDRLMTTVTQNRLHWTFYTSMDNMIWSPLATIPSLTFIEEDSRSIARIIFPTPIKAVRYIKAVVTADPGLDNAFFTEILAQDEINGSSGTVSNDYTAENYQTSVTYRPWEPFQIGYSFSRSLTDSDRSPLSTQDNHTVSSHLNLNRFFMVSTSLSRNIDDVEKQEKRKTNSASVSYQATPVDTMTFSLNGTRSDYYIDSFKERSISSISTTLATVIIPDFTANVSYQTSTSKNYIDNNDTTSDSYTINLMARINPQLNLSYYYSYNEIGTHNASLLFHPSDLLSFTLNAMLTEETQSYSASTHYQLTRKIQADAHYLFTTTDGDESHGSRLNLNWDMSSFLSIRNSLAWQQDSMGDSWWGLVTISYNF
jgi:hypothetical protein